jgi:class 3 adenylate cyclase
MHDATPEGVRQAHLDDLQAQDKHGVTYLKYWYDDKRKTICCLVEAPSPEACQAVHREAHGNLADEIIPVETDLIASFLGGGSEDDVGCVVRTNGEPDGAFRTLMFTDIVGSTALAEERGDAEAVRLVQVHDDLVRSELEAHEGRWVKHTGDGVLASFVEASRGVQCAISLQERFAAHREANASDDVHIRVGLSAGEPVAANNDLFGSAVNLAARVCDQAGTDQVVVAGVVRDLCMGKGMAFSSRGEEALKGFTEPVRLYEVAPSAPAESE